MSGIIWNLRQNPDHFEPVFDTNVYVDDTRDYVDGEMWAYGYMNGIYMQRDSWNKFFKSEHSAEVLRPIRLLGADKLTLEVNTDSQHFILTVIFR